MELLLVVLCLAVVGFGVWLIASDVRKRRDGEAQGDEEALAEVLRLRRDGISEDRMPDELLRRAERAGKRRRKEERGDWS